MYFIIYGCVSVISRQNYFCIFWLFYIKKKVLIMRVYQQLGIRWTLIWTGDSCAYRASQPMGRKECVKKKNISWFSFAKHYDNIAMNGV